MHLKGWSIYRVFGSLESVHDPESRLERTVLSIGLSLQISGLNIFSKIIGSPFGQRNFNSLHLT